ncbi:hypothetical protein RHSIM_Rhsim07G0138500 [Rhododendron simsii]|uniref:Protein kinase domain-containing protein n=1 Tax=Rhododendron simsii TaxID=118357 RepID=A0A834LIN7_RHOSS|nr:hypothetical protein RHSIM_Rhsim07G0138500 [Rhododendron simsii]
MSKLHIRFLPSQLYLESFSDTFHACSALLVQYPVVTDEKSSSSNIFWLDQIWTGVKMLCSSLVLLYMPYCHLGAFVLHGTSGWYRYKIIKEVGDGTFGTVWRAINKQSGEVVAIKKMKRKYYSWEECINLREVKSLRKMNHPNIVKLKEVIRENDILYFVFEYMECNLYQLIKDRAKLFSEAEVRNWCFQVFQGLAYMHQRGYFHRDLKPENLLVSKDLIKIADFGLAREISSQPPYTEYVSTRWYRAPEVLLQSPLYDSAVGELMEINLVKKLMIMPSNFKFVIGFLPSYTRYVGNGCNHGRTVYPPSPFSRLKIMTLVKPLKLFFTVEEVKSEADEIYKICSVLGTPTESVWAEGLKLANDINYQFPQLTGVHLSVLIPSASEDAVNFITSLCSWDPCKRPTALEALQHPFFQSCFYIPPSLRSKSAVTRTPPSAGTRGALEQKSVRRYSGTLPNLKHASNLPPAKSHVSVTTGVQRKLELNNQDAIKNDKFMKAVAKPQPRYRPPARNSPTSIYNGKVARGVSETAEKLGNMALGSARVPARHAVPAPMKAGGWHGQPHLFLGRSQEIQPGRSLSRKVAG